MASSKAEAHESRRSIRSQLLLLLLGLTTAAVLAVGYLGVNSVQRIGRNARQTSGEALRSQASEYLRQVTLGDVQKNDLVLSSVESDAKKVAQYAGRVFENRESVLDGSYWQVEDHMFVASDGQYMNSEDDVSSVFVPQFIEIDEETRTTLELGSYLDFVFAPTYDESANTVAIYLGTEYETTQYYPNIGLGNVVPPDFTVTERPWYIGASPENNPDREVVWTPVYVDATGKGLLVTAAAPVYANDEFVGAVGVDVTLDDIAASVRETRLLGSGYGFLIDGQGRAIALPEEGYRDLLGREPEPEEVATDLSGAETPFAPVLGDMMAGSQGFETLEVDGRELYVAYAPLKSTGWSLANVVETQSVLQALASLDSDLRRSTRSLMLTRLLPLGAAVLALVTVVGLLITRRLTQPIKEIAAVAERIGAGEWDVSLPRATNDEVGRLADAFRRMMEELRGLYQELEDKVAAQTRDLRQRAVQLETSARVAREAAALQNVDVDQLLDETVRLISDRFGFYHAGIFLVDEALEYAVLKAASSEGGQRMLARQHRLKVGEVGIVGYVAGAMEPRIALDVGEDAVFFDNPDLPQTRSEMALPLQARGELIGVLDVQSVKAEAFDDEDVAVLQTMADQLALAIDNARLLNEAEERVEEIQALLNRQSREGWDRIAGTHPAWGYVYDGTSVFARAEDQERSLALTEEEAQLSVPLQVRGGHVGNLKLKLGGRSLTAEEEALIQEIVDRAGQALESARLFQETQRALSEVQALNAVAATVSRSLQLDDVLQDILEQTRSLTGCEVGLISLVDAQSDRLYLAVDQNLPEALRRRLLDQGMEGTLCDYVYKEGAVLTVPDLTGEAPIDVEGLLDLGFRSYLGIPLVSKGDIVGTICVFSYDEYALDPHLTSLLEGVGRQVGVAIENAQLFAQARQRADRERLSAEISSRVWASTDVDTILRTAVHELGRSLQASDAWIELEPGNGASDDNERGDDPRWVLTGGNGDGSGRKEPTRGGEE